MSIRPIDMQVSVNKTAMVSKAHNTQSNLERAMVSDSSHRALEKKIELENQSVVKASKEKTEVNKDGRNKDNNENSNPKEKSRREKKEEELKLINKSKSRNNHHKESFFDIGV